MSEQRSSVPLVQAKRTVSDLISSDKARAEIAKVLPKHLTPERMTRVALTATMKNPTLLSCQPESLMNALLVCSQAGLEPDGRLAHLIPFGNQVQVIFDYKGLVTLIRRNGADLVYGDKVCEYDDFDAWVQDGDKKLTHKVNWKKPRGTAYLYYAVIKQNGVMDYEVMTVDEVEDVRKRSRAGDNGPWKTDFDEMAKKTVLRRMSKRYDLLPEIRDVINADDDTLPVVQVAPKKPVFDVPTTVKVEPPTPEPEPPADDNLSPAEDGPFPPPDPEPPPRKPGPLKLLRDLCKVAKIKEGELLDYLASTGTSEGTSSSLEELQMTEPGIVKLCCDKWAEVVAKIQEMKKAGQQ
jgi:recombination protein RecT